MLLNCGIGEDSWESFGLQGDPTSPSQRRSVLGVHWKDWWWSWNFPIIWPPDVKNWLIWKDSDAGKDWRQEEKRVTEGKVIGWHHWFNGPALELVLGNGEGQGSLACCRPRVTESDMTEWLNHNRNRKAEPLVLCYCLRHLPTHKIAIKLWSLLHTY